MEGYRRDSRDHFSNAEEFTDLKAASVCELSITVVLYHKLHRQFPFWGVDVVTWRARILYMVFMYPIMKILF
jgi:hypothetical protein